MSIQNCSEYFKNLLKNSGLKIVYDTLKKIAVSTTDSFGAVLPTGEDLEKSTKKYNYIDENGNIIKRREKFNRKINFQILISESNISKIEKIFTKFMSEIDEFVKLENGELALIEVGKVEYIDKNDTILKSEITLQVDILVTEKIYKDIPFKNINWGGDGEYVKENC